MAKKTKRQRQQLKQKEVQLSLLQQHKRALMLIENGHYASGVVFLEKVFTSDPENKEVKSQLLDAYDQFISNSIQLKEFKKADTILNKRLKLSKEQINSWLILDVLVHNNKYAEALAHYSEFHVRMTNPSLKEKNLLSKLIPYVFATFDTLPKVFKATGFYKESELAYQLFQQTINGNFNDSQVKRIGILGPYKDLRIILKAIQCIDIDNDDAQTYLLKIKESSVFYDLAIVLQAATTKPYLVFDILKRIPKEGLLLFKKLKGLNDKEYKLLLKLLAEKKHHDIPDYMFNILLSHSDVFGEHSSDLLKGQLCHAEYGVNKYQKTFGKLSQIDAIKYDALWHEKAHKYCYDALTSFGQLVKLYAKSGEQKAKASIVSLHLANHYAADEVKKISYYNDAVKYDPLNSQYYQLLVDEKIKTHGISSSLAMKAITKATDIFPNNVKFQELLITNAYERATYTKAVTFSKKILNTHPVNKKARNILKKSSLSLFLRSANKGRYDKVAADYNDISQYLSEKDQKIFKALILVGNVLAQPLLSTLNEKDLKLLDSNFGLLAFNIQGILLGYTLNHQLGFVADLRDKLKHSLFSLKDLLDVVSHFADEIPKKGYGDISPMINQALKTQDGSVDLLLKLGFLLEDLGLKKILSKFSKHFNSRSAEGQAAIVYFESLKKRRPKKPIKAFAIIDRLEMAKKQLNSNHPLKNRIDKLIKSFLKGLPPQGGFMPPNLEEMLNFLETTV